MAPCDGTEIAMAEIYDAVYVSLHVRVSNRAALTLYRDNLKFRITEVGADRRARGGGE